MTTLTAPDYYTHWQAHWGAWLREHLSARGVTQGALAEAIGANRGTVQRWCTGANHPSVTAVLSVADVLKVDPAQAMAAAGYLSPPTGGPVEFHVVCDSATEAAFVADVLDAHRRECTSA
jgi:transcriptional regulator with XRE-family HTH domain